MIAVHFIRHNIREGLYKDLIQYYMDMSETELYNSIVDKYDADKIKYWGENGIVLKDDVGTEIILEIEDIKPTNFNELVNRIGV